MSCSERRVCRLNNSEECDPGREKSETNPSNHPLPLHRQDTSRTNLTGLKPTEVFFFFPFPLNSFFLSLFFFSFLLPPILYHFYVFFLPSFIYFYVLIFAKIPSYLAYDLSLFLLPSFLPSFLSSFPISLFPPSHLCFIFVFVFFSFLFFLPPFLFFPQVRQQNREC